MRLEGRRLLVTGGSSGIGLATVRAFLRAGARVAVLDLQDAHDLSREDHCFVFRCDIRLEGDVNAGVAQAAQALGGLDGIANCAGVMHGPGLERTEAADWRNVLAINVDGTFLVCKAALPWLRRAQRATIVNVASAQALLPTGSSCYAASKAAVTAFSRCIAVELAPHIRVNAVCPGTIRTPMVERALQANPQRVQANLAAVPMGRVGEAQEVANLIAYLTSDEASFVTGTVIAIDGGRSRH